MSSYFLTALVGRDVKGFYEVCADGLPPDARIVGTQMSPGFGSLLILLVSDEFDPVPEGNSIPEIEPKLRQYMPPTIGTATLATH